MDANIISSDSKLQICWFIVWSQHSCVFKSCSDGKQVQIHTTLTNTSFTNIGESALNMLYEITVNGLPNNSSTSCIHSLSNIPDICDNSN